MKNILVVLAAGLLAGSVVCAHEGDAKRGKNEQEHFQMMKQEMVKDLDARIAILQKVRDCINAAADHAQAKRCHEDEQAAMRSLFEARKRERIKRIEQRQMELESEKQELQKQEAKP